MLELRKIFDNFVPLIYPSQFSVRGMKYLDDKIFPIVEKLMVGFLILMSFHQKQHRSNSNSNFLHPPQCMNQMPLLRRKSYSLQNKNQRLRQYRTNLELVRYCLLSFHIFCPFSPYSGFVMRKIPKKKFLLQFLSIQNVLKVLNKLDQTPTKHLFLQ